MTEIERQQVLKLEAIERLLDEQRKELRRIAEVLGHQSTLPVASTITLANIAELLRRMGESLGDIQLHENETSKV